MRVRCHAVTCVACVTSFSKTSADEIARSVKRPGVANCRGVRDAERNPLDIMMIIIVTVTIIAVENSGRSNAKRTVAPRTSIAKKKSYDVSGTPLDSMCRLHRVITFRVFHRYYRLLLPTVTSKSPKICEIFYPLHFYPSKCVNCSHLFFLFVSMEHLHFYQEENFIWSIIIVIFLQIKILRSAEFSVKQLFQVFLFSSVFCFSFFFS